MTTPDPTPAEAMAKALTDARKAGQRPARFALTPADFTAAFPWLNAPTLPNANAAFHGVPVFRAIFASRSHLWVRADDGQLGNLKANPLHADVPA